MEIPLVAGVTGVDSAPPNTYQILETTSFFEDQIAEVAKAEFRAWIQTMALEPSYFTNLLTSYLILAVQRQVDVQIVHDAYSDYVTNNKFNHLAFLQNTPDKRQHAEILANRATFIKQINRMFKVNKTNVPRGPLSYTPLAGVMGRDHKKISLIDNIGYIGGLNMTPLDAKRVDFMLKTTNKKIVKELERIFKRSFDDEAAEDIVTHCNDHNTLLVDSGKRGKSIIMDHVYELVEKENTSITLISPYQPSGKLRRMLNFSARKGTHVEVITTGSDQTGAAHKLSQFVHDFGQDRARFYTHRYPGIVHAKALLFGTHTAILGSHNFDELFVRLGTEEISLVTRQPEIVLQLQQYAEIMRKTNG